MNTIELKQVVRIAIKNGWEAFAADHPRLAAVMDEQLLVEQATQSIADDPEFQHALSQASVIGITADSVVQLAQRFVTRWLWGLV